MVLNMFAPSASHLVHCITVLKIGIYPPLVPHGPSVTSVVCLLLPLNILLLSLHFGSNFRELLSKFTVVSYLFFLVEADMRREKERKDQESKKNQKVEFIPGGLQPGLVAAAPKPNIPVTGRLLLK